MEFGIFLPNGTNGYILSKTAPRYEPTFAHNKAITLEAEKQGLDFVLSMIKYRGFGGEIGYWDSCLESMTMSAGLLEATEKIGIVGTVGILSQHPVVIARMAATMDEMSGGRFGLNIVTGWNKPEYTQMDMWPGDEHYSNRYQYAREYVDILKDLWEDGQSDYSGQYFNLKDCRCFPTPPNGVRLVCAGQSDNGVRFTAEYADRNFVMAPPDSLAGISDRTKSIAAEAGRDVGTYALFGVVIAETDEQAKAESDAIVAGADLEAIGNVVGNANLDTKGGGTTDVLKAGLIDKPVEQGNMVYMGFPTLVGGYDTLAEKISEIANTTSVDGILFTFPDFVDGIRQFGEHVKPRLKLNS